MGNWRLPRRLGKIKIYTINLEKQPKTLYTVYKLQDNRFSVTCQQYNIEEYSRTHRPKGDKQRMK